MHKSRMRELFFLVLLVWLPLLGVKGEEQEKQEENGKEPKIAETDAREKKGGEAKPEAAGPEKGENAAQAERDGQARRRGNWGGAGRRGALGDMVRRFTQGRSDLDPLAMARRRINEELDKSQPAQLNDLPYGVAKRSVLDVPVGGVDALDGRQNGWAVEEVFPTTEEQNSKLKGLREEYKAELEEVRKLREAIDLGLAERVRTIRKKYEGKANDVLSTAYKSEKEKLDELVDGYWKERAEKNKGFEAAAEKLLVDAEKQVEKLKEAREGDMNFEGAREWMSNSRVISEEVRKTKSELGTIYQDRMKLALTGKAKENLETLIAKSREEAKARADQWQTMREQWGNREREGGGPEQGAKPVVPPQGDF